MYTIRYTGTRKSYRFIGITVTTVTTVTEDISVFPISFKLFPINLLFSDKKKVLSKIFANFAMISINQDT